jgi:hypothetical protein
MSRHMLTSAAAAAVLFTLAASAHAEPTPAHRRLYARFGIAYTTTTSRSGQVTLPDVQGAASIPLKSGPIDGSGMGVDAAQSVPSFTVGYRLPGFDEHLSLEGVITMPVHERLSLTGTVVDQSIAPQALYLPTGIPALGSKFGQFDAATPTFTLVYREDLGSVQPFVGAGVGLLLPYNAHVTNPVLTDITQPGIKVDPAAGLALQGGFEVTLSHQAYVRFDAKYVSLLDTQVTADEVWLRTPKIPILGGLDIGRATADVSLNQLTVQAALGVNF